MAVFANIPKLASVLINKYGTTLLYTYSSNGDYDPTTGTVAAGNVPPQTLKGLPEEYADSVRFLGLKLEAGNLISQGDKKITIAALDFSYAPKISDTLVQLNESFTVIGVAKAFAGEAIAYYVLHLKRT